MMVKISVNSLTKGDEVDLASTKKWDAAARSSKHLHIK
jgi:hypothetical protein